MLKFTLIISILLLVACTKTKQSFQKDKPVQPTKIDFSSVDKYPIFSNCDELLSTKKESKCFARELHAFLHNTLKDHQQKIKQLEKSNFNFYMSIDQSGNIRLDSISPQIKSIASDYLKQIVKKRAENLDIKPALKQGIPVKVNFKLPVKINISN